jgi:hypothetical protein
MQRDRHGVSPVVGFQFLQNVSHMALTHLRPGRYTFEVMASSGNDLWAAPVSSASFTILPHFYERRWFVALAIAATLVLLWLAYVLRLRFATRAIRMRAEERADERITDSCPRTPAARL